MKRGGPNHELIRLRAPRFNHSTVLSDNLEGDELLVVFPFIIHESNTHIIILILYADSLPMKNVHITGTGASNQVHGEAPYISPSF